MKPTCALRFDAQATQINENGIIHRPNSAPFIIEFAGKRRTTPPCKMAIIKPEKDKWNSIWTQC